MGVFRPSILTFVRKDRGGRGKKEGMAMVIKYVLTMYPPHFLYSSEDINVDDNQKDETKYIVQSHYNAITCNKTP